MWTEEAKRNAWRARHGLSYWKDEPLEQRALKAVLIVMGCFAVSMLVLYLTGG
jgi:preprotein translocase subunit Sec61beta